VLERAGGPMPEKQVHDEILQSRGLTETTWSLLRLRAPFVLLGDSQLGLAPRDVPGGAEALDTIVRAVATALHEEQVGWDRQEIERFVHDFGEPWASWGSRLVRSVLRLSGRFRLTRAGGAGLAEWEDARVPIRLPHEAPRLREPTSAEVRASLLERWLISLPERAAPIARELTKADGEDLEESLRVWNDELVAVATWNPAVEHDQVRRLLSLVHLLRDVMDPPADASPRSESEARSARRLRPLVVAALLYLGVAAKARTELVVGSLDDDEAVLSATHDLWLSSIERA